MPAEERELDPNFKIHAWPSSSEHLWSEWMVQDKRHHYRKCVHPNCTASETREVDLRGN